MTTATPDGAVGTDREQIEETLYRYASTIDTGDHESLSALLADDGLFIFTTAGRRAVDKLRDQPERWMLNWMLRDDVRAAFLEDYARDGFAHRDSPNSAGWGYTAAAPSWVCRRIEATTDLRLLGITETKNIDTFSCMRTDPVGRSAG